LLLETRKAVSAVVTPQFSIAVKLNLADWQRGGFTTDDARHMLQLLNGLNVDLV